MNRILVDTAGIDHADVQGNVLCAYGSSYHCTSYLFVHVADASRGRAWLRGLVEHVTSDQRDATLEATLNIALTYAGLAGLGVSPELLQTFSGELRSGMSSSAIRLGDIEASAPTNWQAGLGTGDAHVLVTVNAVNHDLCARRVADLATEIERAGARVVHATHAQSLLGSGEHFGFADGAAQPAIEGVSDHRAAGGGVPLPSGKWRPLAVGEFILGYRDEAARQDAAAKLPQAPADPLGRNGTYMVWRKLEQNVALFRRVLKQAAAHYEDGDEEKLAAKIVGRWRNGTPLVLSADRPVDDFDPFNEGANDFRYNDIDPNGIRCPIGAHIRRSNPRDSLDPNALLTFRHRMIRRGMPYGRPLPDDTTEPDGQERGLVFVCYVASLARQFEGVQAQWIEDGNIFSLGHDKDFLTGSHSAQATKMTVQGFPPFFLSPRRAFVTTRGGEYLFLPGITALGIIADGSAC